MSRDRSRTFYPVAVEPSASALLAAASHARVDEASSRSTLPSYVALNFNFKPDSTHDCKKGALYQSGMSRNANADWQLEMESTEAEEEAGSTSAPDAAKKKPAHVFTGPQNQAKTYDVVLVWDDKARIYRLDRIASTFSLKYERSKTVLSDQSQDVWRSNAVKASKRSVADGDMPRTAAADRHSASASAASGRSAETSSSVASSTKLGELKLRGKGTSVATPVRRSSRISVTAEMEEFDDQFGSPAEALNASTSRSKKSSVSRDHESLNKEEGKRVKLADTTKERASSDELASGLRRSRRRSSQAQTEDGLVSPPLNESGPSVASKVAEAATAEADDDDLALELERELQRELDVEMPDTSGSEDMPLPGAVQASRSAKSTSNRSLSPVSRLKRGERQMKISTPKAHTPDPDGAAVYLSSALSKRSKRSTSSSSTGRSTPVDTGNASSASIGLGLHQTGVGITPNASPLLDRASPAESASALLASAIPSHQADDGEPAAEEAEDEDDDDDLQDFAAELDMSLAEVPDAPGAEAGLPAAVEKRRSSRAHTAAQSVADEGIRQVRKAYGLGGPRQEEEELEDSD